MVNLYLSVNSTAYQIRSVSYTAEADVHAMSLPINSFVCEAMTNGDTLNIRDAAALYDLDGNVYASYFITKLEQIDADFTKVTAESPLGILDETELNMEVYADAGGRNVRDYLTNLLSPIAGHYELASTIGGMLYGGSYPKQTRRERLLWVLFTIDAYCAFSFDGKLIIKSLSSSITLIPRNKIFWKPSLTKTELVTRVECTTFKYEEVIPDNWYDDYIVEETFSDGTDEDVTAERTIMKQTKSKVIFDNTDAPSGTIPNIVDVDDMTCVSPTIAGRVIRRLANHYFTQEEISCDVVNNHEFYPGQRVCVYVDDRTAYTGYISQCDFMFGARNVKSHLKITQCDAQAMGGAITVQYVDIETRVSVFEEEGMFFPLGWHYVYTAKNIDIYFSDVLRIIYRNSTSRLEGTVTESTQIITIQCMPELQYNAERLVITVWGVDEITTETLTENEETLNIICFTGGGALKEPESHWEVTYA